MALDLTGRIGGGPRRMTALLGVTTLVLVAGPPRVLSAAAGGAHLEPPHDVEVSITDDTFTLLWASGSDPGRNVTFSADYQTLEMSTWMKVPGCQYVAGTSCDFSLNVSVYNTVKLRVRAEDGSSASPWRELSPFVPQQKARIGPPEVRLKAEDKAIRISISPPGGRNSIMWAMDQSRFRYTVVFWESPSGERKSRETRYPSYLMSGLSPETTYCVQVKARLFLQRRPAAESPVRCVSTTAEDAERLPRPENVRVVGRGLVYVLQWSHARDNVTFQAQWLYAFLKNTENYETQWEQVPNCQHVRTTQCAFPQSTFWKGLYFLRVRAASGNRTSAWSAETEFDTESQVFVPPPIVVLKAVNSSSLRIYVGAQNKSVYQGYLPIYEVILWENTSSVERKIVEKRVDFTVPHLKGLTLYCVKARALLQTWKWNNSSEFGDTVCERTRPGDSSSVWLVAVPSAVLAAAFALCALQGLRKLVGYVFFPSRAPPSAIDQYIFEQSLKNILLSTSEEQTEKCFIIENIDTVAEAEETSHTGGGHKTYNSQTSEDSGNYSNEDENSGCRESGDLGQEGSVWRE
ncbi:interferon alpha/beta receptor 1 isoform X2 [Phyllostomus hastatus]|uniref:interferon alpha/beta receptor 1 isoform X2 n=1 Tax=Phyllostomus hastatus TaxID=9423 RepID=UPI001E685523|nr:interferon alpha/beta receptor 1 isoform X2 [Phyllostomus hastatus]